MESVGYMIRLNALEGYGAKIQSLVLNPDYSAILAMRHHGAGHKENPHYHIVIRTAVKDQAMRVRLRNIFPDGKGNGHLSMKAWDGQDEAMSYLFHEEPEAQPFVNKGVSDEFLVRLRAINHEQLKAVEAAKQKSSHKLWEVAYAYFSEECKEIRKKNPNYKPMMRTIAEYMIRHALDNGQYVPQGWLLKAMTFRVSYMLDERESQREQTASQILAEIWPTRD